MQDLKQRLQHSYVIAKERLETAKKKSKDYYDKQIHIVTVHFGLREKDGSSVSE